MYKYDQFAEMYDIVELGGQPESTEMNLFLHRLFQKQGAKLLADLTCGTGAQAVGLARLGYQVTASDLSRSMLALARKKGKGLGIRFQEGDIREVRLGNFDGAISMFNAIGHLSRTGFGKAIRNVKENLRSGGIYVFDIFNLEYMTNGGFRNYEYIDTAHENAGMRYVRICNSELDEKKGLIRIDNKVYVQEKMNKPDIYQQRWDMKIYSQSELDDLLQRNGFCNVEYFDGAGTRFLRKKSLSILAVAKKR